MITITAGTVLLTFLVFCRIGGCLMIMPGFGSPRVPVQVRVFLAVSVTLALAPIIIPEVEGDLGKATPPAIAQLILSETMIGVVIGIMARIFFLALQFMGTAAAMLVGFSGMADPPVEEGEPAPAVATLLTLTATVLLFVTGLHVEVMRALVASYSVLTVVDMFDPQFALAKVTDAASDSFILIAQLTSPFLVYSLIVNFLFGIMNKMTPLIPVYFISAPFVLAGGLLLLYFTFSEALTLFISGFQMFLSNG
ncbi:MAG: flagellar type III secretion system protein FliR [Hyphomicrobium zavarzinii]|uniref:flagellar biosynthetic protein FliR n=1 Tax=Hyphomicrobium TaxID=81 RepID=UPI000363520E|nr:MULTISPECIES: flagellar biosynthetic protein FliR [Hyphomicrobium]MBL8847787.1 flagellar type III secretion system protein FliR [Hyphomicrobium zavarzinii]WBT39244.1 flagellar biosynthetic protein FliR [Hyphomicrobium sp. DMF-1]HML43031.1 flagellar biosynthetic protein FliR [Hyphomicrobium zavarzinii]